MSDFETIEELHKTIGANVKRIRESKKMSQIELSLAIGQKSTTIISQAELAKRKKFNLEHLWKLSRALNCDICEFFRKVES